MGRQLIDVPVKSTDSLSVHQFQLHKLSRFHGASVF